MEHLVTDLGQQPRGAAVTFTPKNATNCLALGYSNHQTYKRGGRYTYYGGHVTRSPFRVTIPLSGHWVRGC